MQIRLISALLVTVLVVAGCTSSDKQTGRYELEHDVAPTQPPTLEHIEDAHAKYEPYSLGGNSDYTLRGGDYKIVRDARGYKEKGGASWYGEKFQGHLTSNGEIYDMYSMTAAHKTLPLPSYVKVTNLDNNKSAIVRVNDRGPFHEGRIIDLSYAAAYKLDILRHGVGNVQIEVLTFDKPTDKKALESHPEYVIQVLSSQHIDRVEKVGKTLSTQLKSGALYQSTETNHRLLLGPFSDYSLTQKTLEKVKVQGYSTAFIKKKPESNINSIETMPIESSPSDIEHSNPETVAAKDADTKIDSTEP